MNSARYLESRFRGRSDSSCRLRIDSGRAGYFIPSFYNKTNHPYPWLSLQALRTKIRTLQLDLIRTNIDILTPDLVPPPEPSHRTSLQLDHIPTDIDVNLEPSLGPSHALLPIPLKPSHALFPAPPRAGPSLPSAPVGTDDVSELAALNTRLWQAFNNQKSTVKALRDDKQRLNAELGNKQRVEEEAQSLRSDKQRLVAEVKRLKAELADKQGLEQEVQRLKTDEDRLKAQLVDSRDEEVERLKADKQRSDEEVKRLKAHKSRSDKDRLKAQFADSPEEHELPPCPPTDELGGLSPYELGEVVRDAMVIIRE